MNCSVLPLIIKSQLASCGGAPLTIAEMNVIGCVIHSPTHVAIAIYI